MYQSPEVTNSGTPQKYQDIGTTPESRLSKETVRNGEKSLLVLAVFYCFRLNSTSGTSHLSTLTQANGFTYISIVPAPKSAVLHSLVAT